jgi:hypothetical protein
MEALMTAIVLIGFVFLLAIILFGLSGKGGEGADADVSDPLPGSVAGRPLADPLTEMGSPSGRGEVPGFEDGLTVGRDEPASLELGGSLSDW